MNSHKAKYFFLLSHPVDIDDSYDLKQCDDKQRHRAHVAIEDLHPVVPRALGEYEGHQERHQAIDPCQDKPKLETASASCITNHLAWLGLSPTTIWSGIHAGTSLRSLSGDRTPSTLPNMEERPRKNSMMKNNTAQTCEPGIDSTASVNMMNAKPVPDALWRWWRKKNIKNNKLQNNRNAQGCVFAIGTWSRNCCMLHSLRFSPATSSGFVLLKYSNHWS